MSAIVTQISCFIVLLIIFVSNLHNKFRKSKWGHNSQHTSTKGVVCVVCFLTKLSYAIRYTAFLKRGTDLQQLHTTFVEEYLR